MRRAMVMAAVAGISAFSLAGVVLPASSASAATTKVIDQCNGLNGGPTGATTGLTCEVTVVNTINGASRGSTTTVTRLCKLGPCPGGNGTFTSKSTSLVTGVTQCNSSANDAAPPLVTCRVRITNNVSSDTPSAKSVTAATVNQCVGTGGGAGKYGATGPLVCNPTSASTTGATVTQCNGSVTGGGSTAVCSVASDSTVSPAIAVKVNQCNGTGNKGGTLLTCSTSITNNVTPASNGSTSNGSTSNGSTSNGSTSNGSTPNTTPQVVVPANGVDTGGGSTAGLNDVGLLALGGSLLMVAAMSAMFGWRRTRRD
jgi:hypothetical protein